MTVPGDRPAGQLPFTTGYGTTDWRTITPGDLPLSCLATVVYAPATETPKAITAQSMTAFDSTNLTISFTAPASGNVMVEVLATVQPSAASAKWVIGLLPHGGGPPAGNVYVSIDGSANTQSPRPFKFWITGLAPGTPVQYDLAGAISSGATVTLACFGDTSATPTTDAVGGPVVMEVFAR